MTVPTPGHSGNAAPARAACVMHERNGDHHEPCVHCQLAEVKAERDGALLTIQRVRGGFAEMSNAVGDLAREDVLGDDAAVRYADLRLIFARAAEVLDAA